MDLKRLVIAEPAGNTTALVFDPIAPAQRRFVADLIQQDLPDVEQVMFAVKHGELWHGHMAGKEFCANAARALGYVLAREQAKTTVEFTMSGLTRMVTVDIIGRFTKLKMYTAVNVEQRLLAGEPVPVVHLEGISHAVVTPAHRSFEALRGHAHILDGNTSHNPEIKAALDELGLTDRLASGLLLVSNQQNMVTLSPYVFVRDTNKLYGETACGSGSIAVARILGNDISIRQPSGKILHVTWSQKDRGLNAEVDGEMTVKSDGPFTHLGNAAAARRQTASLTQARQPLAARSG